ncbi:MAG TPA: hypothetical protein VGI75_12090 [Pirellulales bacterium]|jgi:hypothetical protein
MRNQTLKVLSILTNHTVRHLLMGGQACVLYGAVQFSRDADIAILATGENLDSLHKALADLQAEVIAIPPLELRYLEMGLAVHFRCRRPELDGLRIDVMSVMRGVDPFPQLWERRTTLELADGTIEVLSIADLVKAKKTQRDKDWPMIAALVESHYREFKANATAESIEFWLAESRIPESLIEVAASYSDKAKTSIAQRPLIQHAIAGDHSSIRKALVDEQQRQQEEDRQYWKPLVAELERLRHNRTRK